MKGSNFNRREFVLKTLGLATSAGALATLSPEKLLARHMLNDPSRIITIDDDPKSLIDFNEDLILGEGENLRNGLTDSQKVSILQGGTSKTQTIINLALPKNTKFNVALIEQITGEAQHIVSDTSQTFSFHSYRLRSLHFSKLSPSLQYVLEVKSESGSLIDRRGVRTIDTDKEPARVALASCALDLAYGTRELAWKNLAKAKPDVILLMGDNFYVDIPMPVTSWAPQRLIWGRYMQNRRTQGLYFLDHLIPVLATWDDHDFGKNDTNGQVPWREFVQKEFRRFFPVLDGDGFSRGPGINFKWSAFGQDFFMMDSRSYRQHSLFSFTKSTFWGNDQTQWLFDSAEENGNTGWILNGLQFFGGYLPREESFEATSKAELESLLTNLKKKSRKFIFCSGDKHHTEVMKIEKEYLGYSSLELTASGIHQLQLRNPWSTSPNPRQIAAAGGHENFMVINIKRQKSTYLDIFSVASKHNKILYGFSQKI
ncbi:MAG: hypothetical protein COT74_12155 [Bdellovibrionales bacterium CG10_big_fil_rev_8_21_14_0_10_45_34]|nr:MAG: hypothetical protein COT74_12155 [Bdellovibrionales bacterium CG10_big_fil_rev_8_21_14_0_10_45_34]